MKTYLTIILSRFTQYICKSILRIMSFFLISLANKAIWKASIFQGYPAASACHRGQDRPGPPHRASDCYRSNRPSRAFLMRFHSTAVYLSNYPRVAGFSLSASRMASAPWPEIFKRKKNTVSWAPFVRLGREEETERWGPTRVVWKGFSEEQGGRVGRGWEKGTRIHRAHRDGR